MQGISYIFAFLLTWCTWVFLITLQITGRKIPFGLKLVSLILMPLQGFFNSMVYLRPRLLYYHEGDKDNNRGLFRQYSQRAARILRLNRDDDLSETSQQEASDEYALDPSTVFLLSPKEALPPSYGTATRIDELGASGSRLPKEKGEEGRSDRHDKYMGKTASVINSCHSTSTVDA